MSKPKRSLEDGKKINEVLYNISRAIMSVGQSGRLPSTHKNYEGREPIEGIAQATYLMPKSLQQKKFEEFGYQRKDKDYGLVKAAVGDKDIPVYQTHSDAIRREELQPIGNVSNKYLGPSGTGLRHAGSFPSAIYTDANGNLFQKAWDLNDYGDNGRSGAASRYTGLKKIASKLLDTIGSPTVVTTGYQPIINGEQQATLSEPNPNIRKIVDSYLQSKGLTRHNSEIDFTNGKVNITPAFIGLPEIVVAGKRKKYKDGGKRSLESRGKSTNYVTTGGAGYVPNISENMINGFKEQAAKASKKLMFYIWDVHADGIKNPFTFDWSSSNMDNYESGIAQDTFLLPRKLQEEQFLKEGYIKGEKGDYGLVKKAVGKHNYPVYQTAPDAINRDKLIVLGNTYNSFLDYDVDLKHEGSAPSAIYTDGHGKFYQKRWDLNDYGGNGGSTASIAGKLLDIIGSPTVITTGYQPFGFTDDHPYYVHDLKPMMAKKGLVPTEIDNKTQWTLPEVTIVGKRNKKKDGGSIHIAPSKRGTFTAAATKHGMGVQEFAARVLRNKEDYSPSLVKKANFARNASKWNH